MAFCRNCGSELVESAQTCQKCGSDFQISQIAPTGNSNPMAGFGIVVSIIVAFIGLGFYFYPKVVETFIGYFDYSITDNKLIEKLKQSYLPDYPQSTIETAINKFFGDPKWENGISEDGQLFVNISGTISYSGKNVNALLQFFADTTKGTFKINALEFNEIPQNPFIIDELLEAIYKNPIETIPDSIAYQDEVLIDSGVQIGNFLRFEYGDYSHIVILKGVDTVAFWLHATVNEDDFDSGDPVEIKWNKIKRYIPEAGGVMEINAAVEVSHLIQE